jgi:uncharacterized protein YneF (UPF0154 family)
MLHWTPVLLALATGYALGFFVTRIHFKAQLKVCKELIEHRLDAINSSLTCPVLRVMPTAMRPLQEPQQRVS